MDNKKHIIYHLCDGCGCTLDPWEGMYCDDCLQNKQQNDGINPCEKTENVSKNVNFNGYKNVK